MMVESAKVVVTTFINPHVFWIHETRKTKTRKAYERSFAAAPHELKTHIVDVNVVVFIKDCSVWKRATIKSIRPRYSCWLLDYGVWYDTDTIYHCPDSYKLYEPLAQQVSLYNVVGLRRNFHAIQFSPDAIHYAKDQVNMAKNIWFRSIVNRDVVELGTLILEDAVGTLRHLDELMICARLLVINETLFHEAFQENIAEFHANFDCIMRSQFVCQHLDLDQMDNNCDDGKVKSNKPILSTDVPLTTQPNTTYTMHINEENECQVKQKHRKQKKHTKESEELLFNSGNKSVHDEETHFSDINIVVVKKKRKRKHSERMLKKKLCSREQDECVEDIKNQPIKAMIEPVEPQNTREPDPLVESEVDRTLDATTSTRENSVAHELDNGVLEIKSPFLPESNNLDPYKSQLLARKYEPVKLMEISTTPKLVKPIFVNDDRVPFNTNLVCDDFYNDSSSNSTRNSINIDPIANKNPTKNLELSQEHLSDFNCITENDISNNNEKDLFVAYFRKIDDGSLPKKRKRVRKRKRKVAIKVETPVLPIKYTPNSFLTDQSSVSHIRFSDNEDSAVSANEKEDLGQDILLNDTNITSFQNTQSSNNLEQCQEHVQSAIVVLSDEIVAHKKPDVITENSSTPAYDHKVDGSLIQQTATDYLSSSGECFEKLPVMTRLPEAGELIAFKIFTLSEESTPILSSYLVAVVHGKGVEEQNNILVDIIRGGEEWRNQFKFRDPDRNNTDKSCVFAVLLEWSQLITPKLLPTWNTEKTS